MNTEKIEKLKKGLNSSHISDDLKAKIQAEINRLEKEDGKSAPTEKKPRAVRKPAVKKETPKAVEPKAPTKGKNTVLSKAKEIRKEGESWKDAQKRASEMLKKENQTDKELTKSEMKELLALINKNEKLKKLVGTTNVARDASRVSLPAGKRVSKEGNTYYENRINRTDRVRVGKLSLAKGGRVSRVWSEEQSEKVEKLDADFEKEVKKQGINPNSKEASDLWRKGGFKDRMYEIFKDNKAEGGSIPNNYEGKTAEEIWDSWNKKQRQHFLADHADVMDIKDLSAYNKEFKDLQFLTQAQLELHIEQGQYADGGYLTDPTFGQFQAQVYSDGGEVQVYKGFHGLQAENYIDNVDGFDWNIITMKRHTGNLVSSATAGQSKKGKDGIVEIFTHDWDAPKMNLVTSKPSRVTEKVIAEQHKNALEIFREKMADKFEQGGNFDKPFNVIYKTKSGRGMVANNIMAKNEKEAEEKLKKQMRASSTFDKVILVHESFELGGMLSPKERYVLEIKGQTGLSIGAIEKYIDDNNLSDNDVLNIVVGLGRRQLKGADVATAVAGKKGNSESKKLIAFMKDDKAMKMEVGGNTNKYKVGQKFYDTRYDRVSEIVPSSNDALITFVRYNKSGTEIDMTTKQSLIKNQFDYLVNMGAYQFRNYELGGNVGAYDLAGHLGGDFNVGQNNGNLDGFSGTQYTGLVGETGAMSSGEMFELGGGVPAGLEGAVQTYTNAYANEGATAGMYAGGGVIDGNLNKKVQALALKEKFTIDSLGKLAYSKAMTQSLVESLTDANFHKEAKEVVMKAEGKKTWTKELYKSEYFNTDKKVGEFARSVTKICDYDGSDIINAYYFTTKMQGSNVASMIENLFLDKSKLSSKGFVANIEFNTGDVVWDKEEKRYGVVMNNYGDAINGESGEIRLDSTGNTEIFEYNSNYDRIGYKLVKHGSKEDAGNGDVQDIKDSANRLIASQVKSKDKENEKYYREIFKRVLDGEFDKKSTSSSKKYVPHYDIASITVKKGNKQTTFKGSDVLNGANMLKKGGDLSKSATYFPKRDIVSVKLKNGETIHPANGYWVGKTPKMVRTQFEESAFEYEEGGFTNKDGIKVRSVAKPEKELTEKEWMEKHSESNEARAYAEGGKVEHYVLDKEKLNKDAEWYAERIISGKMSTTKESLLQEIEESNKDLFLLEIGRIKPSKIIGTGYKGNTRKMANTWLLEQIYTKKKILELLDGKMNKGGKVTFKEKAIAIAKNFEGKKVEPKYQKEYGKTYDKKEAKEVGNKIAGSQKAMYDSKMSTGGAVKKRTGSPKMKEAHVIAKKIRKEGESWSSALKRAWAELK